MDSLDIVTTARKWLGTPFHHQGRVPNVGLDCVGLVIQVAKELNLSNFDTTNYSAIPDGKVLKSLCEQEMIEVPYINAQYGDVLLFKFGEKTTAFRNYRRLSLWGLFNYSCLCSSR